MRLATSLGFLAFALTGCLNGPGFMKQSGTASINSTPGSPIDNGETSAATVLSDAEGVVTAALDPFSNSTQLVQASGSSGIAGSEVSFPPGSVAIATEITVEEGATLASDSTGSEIGAGSGTLSAASSAMVISSSQAVDASQPFTVSLVLGSSLNLQSGQKLIVVYKIKKASDGSLYVGVIPENELSVAGGKVSFKASYFGSYQAVYTTVEIAKVEKPTSAPIVKKREESSTTPLAATDVTGLKEGTITDTTIELLWTPATVASGYVVRGTEGTTIDAGCRTGKFKPLEGRDTKSFKLDNKSPGTKYTFRVCSVAPNVPDSAGVTITVTTQAGGGNPPPTPPNDPVLSGNFTESSVSVRAQWNSPSSGSEPTHYRVAWNVSAPGTTPSHPANCATGVDVQPDPAGAHQFTFSHLDAGSVVAYRVCSVGPGGVSPGKIGDVTSGSLVNVGCDGGANLDGDCTISVAHVHDAADGPVISGNGNLTLNVANALMAGNQPSLRIHLGGAFPDGVLTINNFACALSVTGKGFPGAPGDSAGQGIGGGASGGKGGGHGGDGGGAKLIQNGSETGDLNFNHPGRGYDDFTWPTEPGSGGGGSPGPVPGGAGGGVIEIRARQVIINGEICANGANGQGGGAPSGGGAGGSIIIMADDVSGNGTVKAVGGDGGGSSGYGGGGGRIAVYHNSLGAVTFDASGGINSAIELKMGAPGTVYFKEGDTGLTALRIANKRNVTTISNFVAKTPLNPNISVHDVQIGSATNGYPAIVYLTNPQRGTNHFGSLVLYAESAIDQSGLGHQGGGNDANGNGPGGGFAQAGATGSGAGYGAAGGTNGLAAAGGAAYGAAEATAPTKWGSGGGGGSGGGANGGDGGGAIRLNVLNTATISGLIRSNGLPGLNGPNCGGGGSGGSVWLKANRIETPAGGIHFAAEGGSGTCGGGTNGAGGGGGRIYLECEESNEGLVSKSSSNGGLGTNVGNDNPNAAVLSANCHPN